MGVGDENINTVMIMNIQIHLLNEVGGCFLDKNYCVRIPSFG